MTLKITVKPGEKFFVGTAEIDIRCDAIKTVVVTGDAPVLRCEDHIYAEDANTTGLRLQYLVQQMYLTRDFNAYHAEYFALAQTMLEETPSSSPMIAEANKFLIAGDIYKAIKLLRRMDESQNFRPGNKGLRLVAAH